MGTFHPPGPLIPQRMHRQLTLLIENKPMLYRWHYRMGKGQIFSGHHCPYRCICYIYDTHSCLSATSTQNAGSFGSSKIVPDAILSFQARYTSTLCLMLRAQICRGRKTRNAASRGCFSVPFPAICTSSTNYKGGASMNESYPAISFQSIQIQRPVLLAPRTFQPLIPVPTLLLRRIRYAQRKVNNNSQQQDDGEECRAKAIIEAGLAAHPNGFRPPVVREQRVHHGGHGDNREQEGGDEGRPVAEVQHPDGQRAEDDGEVQP
jgi:hypothetical protein